MSVSTAASFRLRREDANELRAAIRDRDAGAVLEAMTKQRSTFTPSQLHRALEKEIIRPGRHGDDRATDERLLARFHSAVLAQPELVGLSNTPDGAITRYTTRTVLEAELHVLRAAQGLADNNGHEISDDERAAVLGGTAFAGHDARAGARLPPCDRRGRAGASSTARPAPAKASPWRRSARLTRRPAIA